MTNWTQQAKPLRAVDMSTSFVLLTLSCVFSVICFVLAFLTTGAEVCEAVLAQPADFLWVWVHLLSHTPAENPCATRPGVGSVCGLGQGLILYISRANHNCQLISGMRSLHRSAC